MKKVLILLVVLSLCIVLYAESDLRSFSERSIGIESRTVSSTDSSPATRNSAPPYQIVGNPLNIMTSYYDYFPGSYSSFPLVKQPSPAGMFDGGGLYFIFHSTPEAGSIRRAYYSYILDNQIIGTALLDTGSQGPEGFLGVDMDRETGNPFVSWHGRLPENPDWQTFFTFDQYDAIGFPGLWNEPYCIINNTELEEGYIWPSIKIGPSPHDGMKRVYVMGTNSAPAGQMTQGNNKYLVYADYSDTSDLAAFNPEDWTQYEVPYMREWADVYLRSYDDFVVTKDGKVAIVGTLFDWGSYQDDDWPGGYSEKDAYFVLVNSNYGEGDTEEDWDLYLQYPNMPVDNPDNYFTDEEVPLENLYMVPFAPRFTATVDKDDNVVYPLTFRMASTQANRMYFNQGFIKFVRFDFDTEEFYVNDVWPRSENPEASPYVPWDPEGDGTWEYFHTEDDSFLVVENSWPLWWWENNDFQAETYVRITATGNNIAIVFQESMKARLYHEYNNPNFESWQTIPELYVAISSDNGNTWHDPIIMNGHPESEFFNPILEGRIPSYFYAGDTIDDLGDGNIRLHLVYFDQNSYGSSIQENSPPTGGTLIYFGLDVETGRVSVEEEVHNIAANTLHPNYPNPFNPSTNISFSLSKEDNVEIDVYNVRGQLVKTLTNNRYQPGDHYLTWNGTDDSGREVGSGVYFYRLTTSDRQESRKMLLVK